MFSKLLDSNKTKAETDMDFTQEKFRTKPGLCCWIQQPNSMEKAAATLCSHGQQAARISNKHRHTDNYSTHKYTARHTTQPIQKSQQAPMASSCSPFWLIHVLVGNTHICIYALGIPPASELRHHPPSGLWSRCHWGMQAALEAQSLCNVPGNTLEIPLEFPLSTVIPLCFSVCVCACAETSLLSHNLTKPIFLAAMKRTRYTLVWNCRSSILLHIFFQSWFRNHILQFSTPS